MKLTIENYKGVIPEKDQNLLYSLLLDINELNQLLTESGQNYRSIYIDYIIEHINYSPERTDPCPDYYGMYCIYSEKDPYNKLGDYMDIHTLDDVLCVLINFVETELK